MGACPSKQSHRETRAADGSAGDNERRFRAASVANTTPKPLPINRIHSIAKELLDPNIEQLSATQKERLARQLGYDSVDSMIAASTVVTLSDGAAWWLTIDRFGSWAVWNLCPIDPRPGSQAARSVSAKKAAKTRKWRAAANNSR